MQQQDLIPEIVVLQLFKINFTWISIKKMRSGHNNWCSLKTFSHFDKHNIIDNSNLASFQGYHSIPTHGTLWQIPAWNKIFRWIFDPIDTYLSLESFIGLAQSLKWSFYGWENYILQLPCIWTVAEVVRIGKIENWWRRCKSDFELWSLLKWSILFTCMSLSHQCCEFFHMSAIEIYITDHWTTIMYHPPKYSNIITLRSKMTDKFHNLQALIYLNPRTEG